MRTLPSGKRGTRAAGGECGVRCSDSDSVAVLGRLVTAVEEFLDMIDWAG